MELRRFTTQTKLTNYIPIPRSLLVQGLNSTAVLLYGMLLDRATLSQKNEYTDAAGWVYVVYPIQELSHVLRLSSTTIKDNLRTLERKGLIRRTRRSRKEANQLYICLPDDSVMVTATDENPSVGSRKTVFMRGGKPAPNNLNKQPDLSNTYQHDEEESL